MILETVASHSDGNDLAAAEEAVKGGRGGRNVADELPPLLYARFGRRMNIALGTSLLG
jgi:hypothetical protein